MKIIYGVSGTGKSKYMFEQIKKEIAEKIYIITPEQFSFTAERRLLDTLDEKATLKVEVLSFERMAYKVIKESFQSIKSVGKSGKAMIVYDAITKNAKNLKFLGKSLENVDTVITQITEFKKHNITVEKLEKQIEKTKDEYLKIKLNDMLIIYKQVEDKIDDRFIDENDLLTILAENIEQSHLFDGALFYIDEFAGFTKQEYEVISKLEKIASEVYVTVCTDSLKVQKSPEADIFYDNKQTIQSLCNICELDKDKQIKLEEKYRFKNSELSHLEENLYAFAFKVYNKKPDNIKLYLAENQYNEIQYVATNILKLVRDEGYRYKDIAVICKNLDTYESLCRAIFDEYDIPVFIDTKKDITQNVFIKYVLSIFDIFAKNWSYEAVFNYIKSELIGIDNIYELENYCLKWGIQGKRWYEDTWNYEKGDSANNFVQEQEVITKPLLELKEKLKGRKSAKNISAEIHEFINKKITEICNIDPIEDDEKKASKYNQLELNNIIEAFEIVTDLLDEITEIFGEEQFSFDEYAKLLKTGLATKELNQIPESQDKVIVGDVNRSKSHKVKAVFIIGVNDGVFPSSMTSEGFFNDKDREKLKEEEFELAKGTKEKAYEENFNIYKAFTTAEEKIFISYSASDSDGGILRKSLIISKLRRIFPELEEERNQEDEVLTKKVTFSKLLNNLDKEDWFEVYEWYKENFPDKLESATLGLSYSNLPKNLNRENVEKLYGNKLRTSISKMESFRQCPFSYYLTYGLKLSDKEKLTINSLDTGSFMHNVIDEFFKRIEDVKKLEENEIQKIIDEIVEESLVINSKFMMTAKYRTLVRRLKKVINVSLKYIIQSIKNSSFDVLGTELSFGRGDNPGVEISLDDGRKVLIEGKIDRVDIAKMPDGNYIRIIDYKSSTRDIDLNKVIAGLQIQLITYANEASKMNDAKVAGTLYFPLIEPSILKNNRDFSKEDIEDMIKEQYKMRGLVLADVNIIRAMDNSIEAGSSNIIPVTMKDEKEIDYKRSSALTKEEFENLLKYSNKLIGKIAKEILEGKIDIKPSYNIKEKTSHCKYCKYKSICGFNPKNKGNNYRYVSNKKNDEILDEIAELNMKDEQKK